MTIKNAAPVGAGNGEDQITRNPTPSLADVQVQLGRFAECVFDPTDIIEIRRLPIGRSTFHRASELPQLAAQVIADNNRGEHIYVGANPRARRGGRSTADTALARCLFADFDNMTPDEARHRWQSEGLPEPTLTIASGHGVHAYWRLADPIDPNEQMGDHNDPQAPSGWDVWSDWQRDLAVLLGSDPSVHDAPRIMRLPGFTNHKAPPALCYIIDADPSRVFELAELHHKIPERPKPEPSAPASDIRATPRGLDVLARATQYANKWPGVGEGERNNVTTRHATQLTHDFGLSNQQAWPILAAWNQTNTPPLDEPELRKCLVNGRKYGKNRIGCKADTPPQKATSPGTGAPATDSLPPDPRPSWHTIREIGAMPTYRLGLSPITTGYATLDNVLGGGFRPECVYIFAGRTGAAKTTLALNMCRKIALSGHGVLIFKLEESPTEAVWRMHAAAAQVNLRVLLDGGYALKAHADALLDGWDLLRDLPIRISDRRELDAIGRISREHVVNNGKLIVVDQLSMIDVAECSSQYERVSLISNTLRLLARDLHVPILIVTQVNREASKHKKRGELTANDLRDSGQLENDAAAVLMLDRTIVEPKRGPTDPLTLGVNVAKNRYGPITPPRDAIVLLWWPWFCRIEDKAPVHVEGAP